MDSQLRTGVRGSSGQGTAKSRIFEFLRNNPRGATTDEICIRLGLPMHTASAAIYTMRRKGMCVARKEYRVTRQGRPAQVWARREPLPEKGKPYGQKEG